MLDPPATNQIPRKSWRVWGVRRRRRALTALAIVGLFGWATSGCSSSSTSPVAPIGRARPRRRARRRQQSRRPSDRRCPRPLPSPARVAPPAKAPQPVTIAFAGDTNGEGLPEASMAAAIALRLSPMKGLLSVADLTVVNLETAVTTRGTPATKAFTFRSPPSIVAGMAASGIDVVSMANNHGIDFGPLGLLDSLAAKKAAPIPVIGIGANDDEAFAPARFTVKGQRVAVIGATQILDASLITAWTATADHAGLASAKRIDRLVAEVKRARADSDVVVVFLHWGVEGTTCPSADQKRLALILGHAGADLIVGGHAHRVLAGGFLGQAFVDYGLGNFGFSAHSAEGSRTGVLDVTMQGRRVKGYQWHPGVIRDASPMPLNGAAAVQAVDQWNRQRSCTELTPGRHERDRHRPHRRRRSHAAGARGGPPRRLEQGEVPIGAVVLVDGQVVARRHNEREAQRRSDRPRRGARPARRRRRPSGRDG